MFKIQMNNMAVIQIMSNNLRCIGQKAFVKNEKKVTKVNGNSKRRPKFNLRVCLDGKHKQDRRVLLFGFSSKCHTPMPLQNKKKIFLDIF